MVLMLLFWPDPSLFFSRAAAFLPFLCGGVTMVVPVPLPLPLNFKSEENPTRPFPWLGGRTFHGAW